uniref:Nucleoid-associated protein n=1 Tax=Compsopogon caeruleus TaxID=31354 RepID=A0A7S1TCI2_9RHOD|mmetsp:Transcript_17666/g.36657  ORF Transcript_17666/g.36657 Transcript_17666/m.36657 type:complete len:191 (+) Transcript_17666:1-573(+)
MGFSGTTGDIVVEVLVTFVGIVSFGFVETISRRRAMAFVGGFQPLVESSRRLSRVCSRRTTVAMADDTAGRGSNPFANLGKIGDIMGAMKKAQSFASSAKELQDELKKTELEASSEDGLVTVFYTGQQVPLRVEVAEELLSKGPEAVSASVTEAVQAAHAKSTQHMQLRFGELSQEFGVPLGGNLPNAPQ